jgi:hypothetical protein
MEYFFLESNLAKSSCGMIAILALPQISKRKKETLLVACFFLGCQGTVASSVSKGIFARFQWDHHHKNIILNIILSKN